MLMANSLKTKVFRFPLSAFRSFSYLCADDIRYK